MKNVISDYQNGDKTAEDILIESILELHNYNIDKSEAIILLHKKYGKTKIL